MTRARTKAVHAQPRRTFAAARLQVCANVFACSRIHFDASRSAPGMAALTDRVPAAPAGDGDGRRRAWSRALRRMEITVH